MSEGFAFFRWHSLYKGRCEWRGYRHIVCRVRWKRLITVDQARRAAELPQSIAEEKP